MCILESGSDWQSHLERISDFLVFGENVWWEKTEFGVDFFDYVLHLVLDGSPEFKKYDMENTYLNWEKPHWIVLTH